MASKKKVVDMPVQAEESPIRCEISLGIRENGEVYFITNGPGTDLITIEGLLSYGRQELDRYWEMRAIQQARAAQAAQQGAQ